MDILAAQQHLLKDKHMKAIIETTPSPQFIVGNDVYFALLESIVSQQLSIKAANVIFNRFLQKFPVQQPHPQLVIEYPIEQLRSAGLSNQKARYIQNVAQFAIENDIKNIDWQKMSDEEIIQFLTRIKGVGTWTVEMLLIFTLGRPDVFPVDDLGIQQGMMKLFQLNSTGKTLKSEMLAHAEAWKPYRTVASRYLWLWKDTS